MISYRIIFISIALLMSTVAQAQNLGKERLSIVGGLSYSDYILDSDYNPKINSGFFFGVRKDIRIVPVVHLNLGLLYSQQGALMSVDDLEEIEIKAGYIDIPMGLKVKVGPFFGTGGVSANIKCQDNFDKLESGSELDSFDFVYSLGVGVKFWVISLDLRWNKSFNDAGEINLSDAFVPVENSYFLLGLGIGIHKN